MKTLYISDLDGTLLNTNAELSPETTGILTRLIRSGTAFTFATARTTATAFKIVENVPFSLPAVFMNGVAIYDMSTGKLLKCEPLPPESLHLLKELMREQGVTGFLYNMVNERVVTYYERLDSPVRKEFVESRREKYGKPFRQTESFFDLPDTDMVYLCLLEQHEVLEPVERELSRIPGINWCFYRDVYHPGYWFLEVFNANASKRSAVDYLRGLLAPDEIVGFGDNLNDVPLLEGCERGYAVANATEELKQAATGVIGANTEDGVARFLEEDTQK